MIRKNTTQVLHQNAVSLRT